MRSGIEDIPIIGCFGLKAGDGRLLSSNPQW